MVRSTVRSQSFDSPLRPAQHRPPWWESPQRLRPSALGLKTGTPDLGVQVKFFPVPFPSCSQFPPKWEAKPGPWSLKKGHPLPFNFLQLGWTDPV